MPKVPFNILHYLFLSQSSVTASVHSELGQSERVNFFFSKLSQLDDMRNYILINKMYYLGSIIGNLFLVQFSSVSQLCLTFCDPMNHSTPGPPVHHQLPEFTQTRVHRVSDAIQKCAKILSLPVTNSSEDNMKPDLIRCLVKVEVSLRDSNVKICTFISCV